MRIFLRLSVRKHNRDTSFHPMVSILVPAYNEEKVIAQKIENCLALDYPSEKLEIMVCSDCSTDRTAEIVRQYLNRGVTFFDYNERCGKTGIINNSVPKAKGDIIVLTDANTMFRTDAVRKMVSLYSDDTIGAVLGQVSLVVPEGGDGVQKEVDYRNFEADLKYAEGLFGAAIGAFGGFYSIRKCHFTPLPPNAYSNDDLLTPMYILQKGYKVLFDNEAISMEDTGKNVAEEFKRRVRIGAGNFQSFSLLKKVLNPFQGRRFFFYVSHKVLRWFSPFILLGLFITNMLLWKSRKRLLQLFFIGQLGTYAASILGYIVSRFHISLPIISSLYHFVSMNIAVLFGFFRFLRGIKSAVWQSTERVGPE